MRIIFCKINKRVKQKERLYYQNIQSYIFFKWRDMKFNIKEAKKNVLIYM